MKTNNRNLNWHYLGKFESIEYAKTKYNEVHAVMADYVCDFDQFGVCQNNSGLLHHLHTDSNTPNANWLWFQTYTSIIHGVKGVWYWDINSWGTSTNDGTNKAYMNTTNNDRFIRTRFPDVYQKYVSCLGREIRYLVDKNLIDTDPITILYTKTNQADPNCGIVPAASTYIPSIPGTENHLNENYGLRYTIRTNGTDVIMIITNPLNVAINNVTLNFSNIANPVIKNSTGVEILFEHALPTATTVAQTGTSGYKTNRIFSDINLAGTPSIVWKPYQAYSGNKQLVISFGPMDTHVLKFVSASTSYANGWNRIWSNFGNGNIDGWNVQTTDQFVAGDFDGDGTEELLCVQKFDNNAWATMLKYKNVGGTAYDWEWQWSNYGNGKIGTWGIKTADKYIVGNFDGVAGNELFCIQGYDINSWATMFKYNSGTNSWNCIWTNGTTIPACNLFGPLGTIDGWGIKSGDKFVVGDFDSDNKKELLCIQNFDNNAWATILNYDSNNDWN